MTRKRRTPSPDRVRRDLADALYPTLDLHGMTAAEATAAARRWIESRRDAYEVVVRLVTGRGLHSVGPPVLPPAVEGLLREMSGGAVRSYEREPGGGVYRVRLNRVRSPATPARHGGRPVTARFPREVVRAAEESLADLGIAPSPALIEAEATRIMRRRASRESRPAD